MEELIFTKDELNRIWKNNDMNQIFVDIHGMNRHTAKRFLHNLITLHMDTFKLSVIHGYNNGTALKDMVATENISKRVKFRINNLQNPGRTDLLIETMV